MKKFFSYLVWALAAIALVFASVAIPVALSEEQEKEVTNQVAILNVAEPPQHYLSHTVSLAERVRVFMNADLNIQIARNAYMSELSMEGAIDQTNIFVSNWIEEYCKEMGDITGIITPDAETILSSAEVSALLYESPSGANKIPYWQIEYQWYTKNSQAFTGEEWSIYYLQVLCDTATGEPYLITYAFLRKIPYSQGCGVASFAKALGMEDKIQADKPNIYEGAWNGNETMAKAKKKYYFPIEGQGLCLFKSVRFDGDGREQIQLVPIEKMQE
ncbi:MAG: hypothetical protein ACYCX2_07590 [Christensenellales bacterium]